MKLTLMPQRLNLLISCNSILRKVSLSIAIVLGIVLLFEGRSLTAQPEIPNADITPLVILESRAPEPVIHIYLPTECRCKRITCSPDLSKLEPHRLIILNWGAVTKQLVRFTTSKHDHTQVFYQGNLLIDEINRGLPMWWRFSTNEELKEVISYLQKKLDPLKKESERPLLLIHYDYEIEGIITPEEELFLEEHFNLVGKSNRNLRTFFVKAERTMNSEIQRLELQKPAHIEEVIGEKLTRILSERLKSITLRELLMIIGGSVLLYKGYLVVRQAIS